ncbi:MAG: S-methyl-5-thioribose-1-phosphate isomerase [Bacteroidales bacterium]
MRIGGKDYQSIWLDEGDETVVRVIDQRKLPYYLETKELRSAEEVYDAIRDMTIRGAPLIGVAGAFGMYLATLEINSRTNIREHLKNAARYLISCRPTAVNLSWAVNRVLDRLLTAQHEDSLSGLALRTAVEIREYEIENCRLIGMYGVPLIEELSHAKNGNPVNILTHCNAGWLACVDYGTALAPVYLAHDKGIPLHVWVDETRPLNQGAKLTAWELGSHGVPYTLITDNAGGHLMQTGKVDLVITGGDRATLQGDVANKIGTYLKALAASDNSVPFYCALPSTSVDFTIRDGRAEIIIEEREEEEVTTVSGLAGGTIQTVRICPENAAASNPGFDITPARLITGFITEKGVCKATEEDIKRLFSDKLINDGRGSKV